MLQGIGKKIVPQAAVGDLSAQILWLKEVRMPEGRLANVDRVLREIADPAARACARNRKLSGWHGGILHPHMIEHGFVDMLALDPDILEGAGLEPVSPSRLFSAAELRNDIRLMEAAYAEFDLAGSDFRFAAAFVRHITDLAEDDYWIRLSRRKFDRVADALRLPQPLRQALVHRPGTYTENTNSYAPLVELDGQLTGSVALLSRFLYNWRNVCLYKIRRYQIRSGYIFEQAVSAELEEQGFTLTGIKRINHKEFDVVTTRGGVIFNVQCKNNLVDITKIEANVRLFARYNRARSASYERALRKEKSREDLLRGELGLDQVEHLVLSRFPVASDNPRIIPYNRIGDVGRIASAITKSF